MLKIYLPRGRATLGGRVKPGHGEKGAATARGRAALVGRLSGRP
jgi:hypothetical protein